jgi:hypothetical protein
MYELNVKDDFNNSNIGNKNEVNFTKFVDEDEKKEKKRKNSKKSKNKNYNDKLKDEFIKKNDENEYLGNKNMTKIIIDDGYNNGSINFKTAFSYFSSCDYKEEQDIIDKEKNMYSKKTSFIKRICDCFFNRIPQKIKTEKNLISCITKVKYDENNEIHYKMLSSIYIFFTDEKECPKSGKHWEKIGFQSKTPLSDLRSVGMLAPLQMLYFLCAFPSFSLSVYKLFCSKDAEWLFAVTLINITQICYHLLRDDSLDQFFKKSNDVISIFNELYVGIIYNLNHYLEDNKESLTAEYVAESLEKIKNHSSSSSDIDAILWNIKKVN